MTHHAIPIFHKYGCKTAFIGFTSENRHAPEIIRERKFFHLAGRSQNKGTERLLQTWRKHPEWPTLTVVQDPRSAAPSSPADNVIHRIGYVDNAELRYLQNSHMFHICTSETEGYGHYLVEAMGVSAVVLATNAPPMNEMITTDRGILVDYDHTGTQRLATTYFVSEPGLTDAIERSLTLTEAEVLALGSAAQAWFVDNDHAFSKRLASALEDIFANNLSLKLSQTALHKGLP